MSLRVAGVLLAGGLSRRMGGGDKCLRDLSGRTVLARIIERVRHQVEILALNANGDSARFAGYGLPVVPDGIEGHPGPLAGVLAGMEWAAEAAPHCTHVASFATDAPFVPLTLVGDLCTVVERGDGELACAASGGRRHPVFGLWPVARRDDLRRAVEAEGIRKVEDWTGRFALALVPYPDGERDPFFNANAPEDLAEAAARLRRREGQ
jgi:molybdopterin-guanine dinucleotide biosynthesis protein A